MKNSCIPVYFGFVPIGSIRPLPLGSREVRLFFFSFPPRDLLYSGALECGNAKCAQTCKNKLAAIFFLPNTHIHTYMQATQQSKRSSTYIHMHVKRRVQHVSEHELRGRSLGVVLLRIVCVYKKTLPFTNVRLFLFLSFVAPALLSPVALSALILRFP